MNRRDAHRVQSERCKPHQKRRPDWRGTKEVFHPATRRGSCTPSRDRSARSVNHLCPDKAEERWEPDFRTAFPGYKRSNCRIRMRSTARPATMHRSGSDCHARRSATPRRPAVELSRNHFARPQPNRRSGTRTPTGHSHCPRYLPRSDVAGHRALVRQTRCSARERATRHCPETSAAESPTTRNHR